MSFRLVQKSVTLNDLQRHYGPYFALFHQISTVASGALCKSGWKKFTFAISSPDEFLVSYIPAWYRDGAGNTIEENSIVFSLTQMR